MPGQDQGEGQGRNDDLLPDGPSRRVDHEDGRPDVADATTATSHPTTTSTTATTTSSSDAAATSADTKYDERKLPK